jgi:hypothetical protein
MLYALQAAVAEALSESCGGAALTAGVQFGEGSARRSCVDWLLRRRTGDAARYATVEIHGTVLRSAKLFGCAFALRTRGLPGHESLTVGTLVTTFLTTPLLATPENRAQNI